MPKENQIFLMLALLTTFLMGSFTLFLGEVESAFQALPESIDSSQEISSLEATAALTVPNEYMSSQDISSLEMTGVLTVPDGYRTGEWPTIPSTYSLYSEESYTPRLMQGKPQVTMNDELTTTISFSTVTAIPTVTVYYGVYEPDALLSSARFIHVAREKLNQENSYQHEVTFKLDRVFLAETNMTKEGGGVIAYRIELYNPDAEQTESSVVESTARFYDGRFEFVNGQLVPTVNQGPFVDQVTENSAIISWETELSVITGSVQLEGIGDFMTDTNSSQSAFEIPLTGLTPGTAYTYTVSLSDALTTTTTQPYSFRTPAADATQFSFAVLGDSRAGLGGGERDINAVNAYTLKQLTRNAYTRDAEFIVHTGNMVNGYTPSSTNLSQQLYSFKNALESVGHYIPIYEVIGNHESVLYKFRNVNDPDDVLWLDPPGSTSAERIFANQFVNPTNGATVDYDAANVPGGSVIPSYEENTYYFDYGNSRFVVMNTNFWWGNKPETNGLNLEGYVLDDQLAWLTDVLNDTEADDTIDHLFLFAHEPMFPNSNSTSNGMWYNGGAPTLNGGLDRTYIVERRDQIWQAFVGTGKAVAANFGDEHNYSRTCPTADKDGNNFASPAWQLISGGGGAPVDLELKTNLPWSDDVEKFSSQLHYTLLRVDGEEVRLEVISIDDQVIESVVLKDQSGTVSCNAAEVEPVDAPFVSNLPSLVHDSQEPISVTLPPPSNYRTGLWPAIPSTYTKSNNIEGFIWMLMGEPEVTMSDQWTATISFTTTIPTPAVKVYYGVYSPEALLPWPHYLRSVKEELVGESTQHEVTLSNLNLTSEMEAQGGGQIVYRVEIYNPKARETAVYGAKTIMRSYDHRFEFLNGDVGPTVSEGPFVDQVTENSAIISWETDKPVMTGSVEVEGLGDFMTDTNSSHFEIPLTGLTPGTTYTYSVSVGDGMNTTSTRHYSFRTPAADLTDFTFAVMGDSRLTPGGGERGFNGANVFALKNLTRHAFNKDVEFIVHTGDLVSGYTTSVQNFESQLASFKDAMERVGHYIPIYELIGNHEALIDFYIVPSNRSQQLSIDKEGAQSAEAIFANAFVNPTNGPTPNRDVAQVPDDKELPPYEENVYHFDYGNSRFVMMNNNYWWSSLPETFGGNLEGNVLQDQTTWLTQVFSDTKTDDTIEHVFLFAQEPMFPNSSHTSDAMWYNNGSSNYPISSSIAPNPLWNRSYVIERRDEIWRAFVGTGKAAAANFGDEHNYNRTLITKDKDGNNFDAPVWQIISGGAGSPAFFKRDQRVPWSEDLERFTGQLHYTLLNIENEAVTLEVYNIDGMLIDTVNLTDQKPYAPVAADDSYTTDEDTELTVAAPGVLDNDRDLNQDILSATLESGPLNGTLEFSGDGSFVYTPNENFNGQDGFTYILSDGELTDSAEVTISVTSVNDAPVAVDDSYSTDEDTELTVAAPGVLSNDSDLDGGTLSATLENDVSNGTVELAGDGSFVYTPDENFNGQDGFSYIVSDGELTDTAEVSITVTSINKAPVAVDDSYSTDEDTALTVAAPGVLDNDSDLDGDTLSATLENTPSNGTLELAGDGSFVYTPDENFNGQDSFTYLVSDGDLTDSAEVTISVTSINDTPIVDAGSDQSADEGEEVQFEGSYSDPGLLLAPGVSIEWDFGDGNSVEDTLTPVHTYLDDGVFTVMLTVTDAEGASSSDTLDVTVSNVAPVVDAGSDMTGTVDIAADFSGNFSDPGILDTHTVAWDFGDGNSLSDTLTPSHTYESAGTFIVTLTVTDDEGAMAEDQLTITVIDQTVTAVSLSNFDKQVTINWWLMLALLFLLGTGVSFRLRKLASQQQ